VLSGVPANTDPKPGARSGPLRWQSGVISFARL
jgi:hypothetical protein